MANSRFEYVKGFEKADNLLPETYIVIRIDGKGFHKFTEKHEFAKPNDSRCLELMNKAAEIVVSEFTDIVLAYGDSDEYSFVWCKGTQLYERRESKLVSHVCSLFTSAFVFNWSKFFDIPLRSLPSFDGRAVLYPSFSSLRDYLSWRQADCHINNLYNTTFWALRLQGKMSNREAEERLKGTVSADKHEILFSQFGINYNNEPEMYKKGTIFTRKPADGDDMLSKGTNLSKKQKKKLVIEKLHVDLIADSFWKERPYLETFMNQ
ncbi:tRNA guanylyltransferase [Schizosaccharomyces japonicus yFS275]|uniref:tRNA(His) guanylyltransferase n=1 Tax=Schizosaccharomyces japonicus (strain yFS275 / FY16936) TaxID=402676 RepID=B6K6A5_SCHJY|nr:tRNA guanylyltransferase [Schizosaccharomyces japonicus yFS275]EEB09059.1 tRNA guanylyltransferase [Schizosaccharomyces japonicus yFS275]